MTDTTRHDAVERLAAFADWLSPEDEDKLLELDGVDFKAEDAQSIIADLKTQSAEIERLRADCERFRSEADIANAQVKAWNEAVYVEGIPRRAIPDTDYDDKVPPIPHVEPKRLTDLLSERGRLRKSLIDMITAIQDGQIDSPELGGGDVPIHRWHEEWLHHAEQALKGGA